MQLGETGALSRPLTLHTFLLVLSSAPTSKLLFVLGKFKKNPTSENFSSGVWVFLKGFLPKSFYLTEFTMPQKMLHAEFPRLKLNL